MARTAVPMSFGGDDRFWVDQTEGWIGVKETHRGWIGRVWVIGLELGLSLSLSLSLSTCLSPKMV